MRSRSFPCWLVAIVLLFTAFGSAWYRYIDDILLVANKTQRPLKVNEIAESAVNAATTTQSQRGVQGSHSVVANSKSLPEGIAASPWVTRRSGLAKSFSICSRYGINAGSGYKRPKVCADALFRADGNSMQMYLTERHSRSTKCLIAQWSAEEVVAVFAHYWDKSWGSPCRVRKNTSMGVSRSCKVTWLETEGKCGGKFDYMHHNHCVLHVSRSGSSSCDITDFTARHRALVHLSGIPSMVDAGANIGDAAFILPAEGIHVFAMEPGPRFQEGFDVNFGANARSQSYPLYFFAGGAADTKSKLWYPGGGNTGVTLHGTEQECRTAGRGSRCSSIPVERIDGVVPHNFPIGFIKVDVEGLEARVLWGGHGLFCSKSPPRIIEFEHVRTHGVPQCGFPSDYYGRDCQTLLKGMLGRLYDYGYNCSYLEARTELDSSIASIIEKAVAAARKEIQISASTGIERHSLQITALASKYAGIGTSSLEHMLARVPGKSDILCVWRRQQSSGACIGPQK